MIIKETNYQNTNFISNLFLGDIIRDIEDEDCYYEGVIVSVNPIKYKITKIIWCGELDNSMNGQILQLKWFILKKIE